MTVFIKAYRREGPGMPSANVPTWVNLAHVVSVEAAEDGWLVLSGGVGGSSFHRWAPGALDAFPDPRHLLYVTRDLRHG